MIRNKSSSEPLYLNWKKDIESIDWSKVHSEDIETRFAHPSTRFLANRIWTFLFGLWR